MNKFVIYFFITTFLLLSCGNKKKVNYYTDISSDEENNEKDVKLISKITEPSTDICTEFTYDENNRVTRIKTWNSEDFKISYTKDNKLIYNTKSWEDVPIKVTYTLNDKNTVTDLSVESDGETTNISYTYDENNRLIKITPKGKGRDKDEKQILKWTGNTLESLTSYCQAGWGMPEITKVKCNDTNVKGININFIISNTLIDFGYDNLAKYLFALGYMGNTSEKLFSISNMEYQDYNMYKEKCSYKYDKDGYPVEVILNKKIHYIDEEEPFTEEHKYLIEYK